MPEGAGEDGGPDRGEEQDAGLDGGPAEAQDGGPREGGDAGRDAGGDGGLPDAGRADGGGASCRPFGERCASPSDCCGGDCVGAVCTPRSCVEPAGTCTSSFDCCSLNCRVADGISRCQDGGVCASQTEGCTRSSDCCSAECDAGSCSASSGGCRAANQRCESNFNCCSNNCSNSLCVGDGLPCLAAGELSSSNSRCCSTELDPNGRCRPLRICRPSGEPCAQGAQCCTLSCSAGHCQSLLYCRATFEPCATDAECCSGQCERAAGGFKICQPIGGCRTSGPVLATDSRLNVFGEICQTAQDCCSGSCELDPNGIRRCRKRGDPRSSATNPVCLGEGDLCDSDPECCQPTSGPVVTCVRPPDSPGFIGFPKRCLGGGPCRADGISCVDASQCCAGMCAPHPDGFRCGAPPIDAGVSDAGTDAGVDAGTADAGPVCVGYNGRCSSGRDCCSSLQCLPDGAGGLVCSIALN